MKQKHIAPKPTLFKRWFSKDGHPAKGWFSVRHTLMYEQEDRRKSHGEWFKIRNGKNFIYRVLRFDVTLPEEKEKVHKIGIDWGGWLDLIKDFEKEEEVVDKDAKTPDETVKPLNLIIKRANWFEVLFIASARHPEPSYRLSFFLALVSLGLGVISLLVAFL